MRGRSLAQVCQDLRGYLPGWKNYFQPVELRTLFRELDSWIRHRLRALQLKQWVRGVTVFRELRARGVSPRDARRAAGNTTRWWRTSGMVVLSVALPNSLFDKLGLPRLAT
jgi:RNA-directed DNA polymerase